MTYYTWRSYARDVAVCCAGSVAAGLGLAVVADLVLANKAGAMPYEIGLIEKTVERAAGTRILWVRGRGHGCDQSDLLGFYTPEQNRVTMCQTNIGQSVPKGLEILKHEGWHAVQFRCNQGRPVLRDSQLRNGMRQSDKAILRNAYPKHQHRLEAEARTVAQLPTKNFLAGVEAYCRHRV